MDNEDFMDMPENGFDIIERMKELRIKYYPNVEVENFSAEDRELYESLEENLQTIINESGQNSGLEQEKNVMLYRTNPVIPHIDKDFYENEAHSVYLIQQAAQGAADIEIMAIQQGDYAKAMECATVRDRAFAEFDNDSYMGPSARKVLEQYRQTNLALIHRAVFDAQLEYYKSLEFRDVDEVEQHEKVFKDLCVLLDTVDSDYENKLNSERFLQEIKQAKIQEREQREVETAKLEEERQRIAEEQAKKAKEEAELREFMAQIEDNAREAMKHTNDLNQNPWKAVIENFQVLESITDEDKRAEIKREMCQEAMVSFIRKQEKTRDMSAIIQGFSSMYGEEYYQVLSNFDNLTQERVELAARLTILETSVDKWKEKGFASTIDLDVFLKETTLKDIGFIMDLYDFNAYKDFADFKNQYRSFCEVLNSFSRSENEDIRQYIEQRFGSIQSYELLLGDEEKLRNLYEKGVIGFSDVLEKAGMITHEKRDEQGNKNSGDIDYFEFDDMPQSFWDETPEALEEEEPKVEEPKVEEPKIEEPKIEEPKVEEPKIDNSDKNNEDHEEEPPIKPQPERITPKHMQAGWHMRSIEEMEIEAGLRAKPGAKKGPPQKIKPKDIRKHMQDDWQMESVEDMEYKAGLISKDELKAIKEEKEKAKEEAQKELARQEAKAEKSWKARFKKWHEISKEIPMGERNPMAEAIVNQIEAAKRNKGKGKDTMERD